MQIIIRRVQVLKLEINLKFSFHFVKALDSQRTLEGMCIDVWVC